MTDRLLAARLSDGVVEELVLYAPVLCAPDRASDGVWLTGRIGALSAVESHPHPGPLPQGEGGQSGWRAVVVGALLVGGLWGVAVAWTLLALVRAM